MRYMRTKCPWGSISDRIKMEVIRVMVPKIVKLISDDNENVFFYISARHQCAATPWLRITGLRDCSTFYFVDEVACVDPAICKAVCDNEMSCSNTAYTRLVLGLMPTGIKLL